METNNYYHPVNHNRRVKQLIRKFNNKLDRAKGERSEILDGLRFGCGDVLSPEQDARCSQLYLQIADLSATIEQLRKLILPEGK